MIILATAILGLLIPTLLWPVSWLKSGPVIDTMQLTLWAATDPREDKEVAKIDPAQFYGYITTYSSLYSSISGYKSIAKTIAMLKIHGKKSGTYGVKWTPTFAKMSSVNFVGRSVKRMAGIHSLIYWMNRNLGATSVVAPYNLTRLISFTLKNKENILKMIRETDEERLIRYMYKISALCAINAVIWENVIKYLIERRRLFVPSDFSMLHI
ncbi:uncharacterized protein LOC141855801 [Brevipalpus obovatus]|uniref:uncharacterized protein LOC141855801 n=1 Tax=Brevipalpus obovatus TaxID=246614 RepID=UPI003D9ECA87